MSIAAPQLVQRKLQSFTTYLHCVLPLITSFQYIILKVKINHYIMTYNQLNIDVVLQKSMHAFMKNCPKHY